MMSNLSSVRNALATMIVLALIGSAVAADAAPEVRDDAGFFTAAAVSEANTGIRAIKQRYKKDLLVETFLAVPADLKEQLQENKNKTFVDWTQSQAAKNKLAGVYLLICKEPPHLELLVDNASLKKAFPATDRDKLRDLLLKRFREKDYDKGLAETVALVRERLEQNLGPVAPGPVRNVVQDQGGFFSPTQVARINAEIKEFNQRFKKDLMVETFAAPPPDKQKLLAVASADEKTKIFKSWVHERAKEAKAEGIVVLICREPPHIQVEVSAGIEKKAFAAKDRDRLVSLLVSRFKTKEYDKALEDTLDFVYDTVDRNLAPALPAPVSGTLKDYAGLFTAAAVQKAVQDIQTLGKEFRQTLTIETFAQPPPGQVKRVEALKADARSTFFAGWLAERTQSLKGDGIYLLICKHPGHIQIGLGAATQQKAFTLANRDELAKSLAASFKAKQFDQGLLKAMDYISVTLAKNIEKLATKDGGTLPKKQASLAPVEKNDPVVVQPKEVLTPATKENTDTPAPKVASAPPEASKQTRFDVTWILYGLGILIGLWFVIGLLRALFGGGRRPTPPPQQSGFPPQQSGFPPQQSGYPMNTGRPPLAGPGPGYGANQGYPQQQYPGPQQAPSSGGSGGFLPSLMGGLFGGAAGAWISDRMRGGPSGPASYPPVTHASVPPAGADRPSPSSEPGYSSAGGDFGDTAPSEPGYTSSGGDFGAAPEQTASEQPASSGGDFGSQESPASEAPASENVAGGDFGAAPETTESGGGDFGGAAPDSTGGDFGGDSGSDNNG